tara:strand:+ start:914 stop:1576 length:663 start_codon:yes stop_codon:yes gene_type:complete
VTSNKYILKKDILIIIPAKDEYLNLKVLFKHLKKFKIKILIIDDNSKDKTNKIAKLFPKVKLIKNRISCGYDECIKKGLRFAKSRYKYAITMDADFEHDPKYIPKFIKKLSKYNLVIGNRDRKNRILEIIFGFFFEKKYKIKDLFCGYRGINLKLVDSKNLSRKIDMPQIIFNLNKKNITTTNINIKSTKRLDKSRFGNSIYGNYKIFTQFIKIFLRNFR